MAGGGRPGRRRAGIIGGAVVVVVLLAGAGLWFAAGGSGDGWGTEGDRVASPTGEFEVVTYEWSAMIDPGWNLAIERADGEGREWFWRSAEMPAPRAIRFTGPTTVQVTDDLDRVYEVEFDPETLEPSDRFCANPSYCHGSPWDTFTAHTP